MVAEAGSERTVQLAGVWTPGIEADDAARESRATLERLAVDRRVRLEFPPEASGEPPAALIHLVPGRLVLNELLVESGMGFADREAKIDAGVAKRIAKAEDAARAKMLGFWGPVDALRRSPAGLDAERFAAQWLKTGDGLKARNPAAAKEWYRRVVKEHPDAAAAYEARKRLGIPGPEWAMPPLDSETARKVLGGYRRGMPMTRANLP